VTGTNPSYTCRRTAGGKCEAPTYVSKKRADAHVEEMVVDVLSRGKLDVIVSSQDVERLRQAWKDAQAELESFVVAASSLDAALFKLGLEARQDAVQSARDAFDEAVAQAESAAVLPDVSGWAMLDLDGKRRVARVLISKIVVTPAISRGPNADVAARLEFRWNGSR
jgi:hypothetical protein